LNSSAIEPAAFRTRDQRFRKPLHVLDVIQAVFAPKQVFLYFRQFRLVNDVIEHVFFESVLGDVKDGHHLSFVAESMTATKADDSILLPGNAITGQSVCADKLGRRDGHDDFIPPCLPSPPGRETVPSDGQSTTASP
jgi:hypothetical protein